MAYSDGNPPSSWYDPPEEPKTEEENEEFEPDDSQYDSHLEDQYIQSIERDYDRYLNWLYK